MRDGDEPHSLGKAEVMFGREKAILVKLENKHNEQDRWVPRSVIHEDSDVPADSTKGDKGELFVQAWWAEKEGL